MALFILFVAFLLAVLIINGIEVIEDIWFDDFAYDTQGLNGWDIYYLTDGSNKDYSPIPFINGTLGTYHGVYQNNAVTGKSIHYLRRTFQCNHHSSIKITYNIAFCGNQNSGHYMFHSNGKFKFRIDFLEANRLYLLNDISIEYNYVSGSHQWYVYYDTTNTKTLETFVAANVSFLIKMEVELPTSDDLAVINGIIIFCDPAITTKSPTYTTSAPNTKQPTIQPTVQPTVQPTIQPTIQPTVQPIPMFTTETSAPSTKQPTVQPIPMLTTQIAAETSNYNPTVLTIGTTTNKAEGNIQSTLRTTIDISANEVNEVTSGNSAFIYIMIIIGFAGILFIVGVMWLVLKYRKSNKDATNDVNHIEITLGQSPTTQGNETNNKGNEDDTKTKHNTVDSEDMYISNSNDGVTPQNEGDMICKSVTKGNDGGSEDDKNESNNLSDTEELYENNVTTKGLEHNEQVIDNDLNKMCMTPNNTTIGNL